MKSTRLYVGGYGDGVDEKELIKKFSPYGSVLSADLKDKRDYEGNVMQRFAYVNIEATRDQLEKCFSTLNGIMLRGSAIKIEAAKESFLDRLKREREERQEGGFDYAPRPKRYDPGTSKSNSYSVEPYAKEHKVHINEKHKPKGNVDEPGVLPPNLKFGRDRNENDLQPPKSKMKKGNAAEEEMMESFKTYSSFWADSEEEDDGSSLKISNKEKKRLEEAQNRRLQDSPSDNEMETFSDAMDDNEDDQTPAGLGDKRQRWGIPSKFSRQDTDDAKKMTRYDPTLEEHQENFQIQPPQAERKEKADGPVDSQKDSKEGFSLLAMFDSMRTDDAVSEQMVDKQQNRDSAASGEGKIDVPYKEMTRYDPTQKEDQKKFDAVTPPKEKKKIKKKVQSEKKKVMLQEKKERLEKELLEKRLKDPLVSKGWNLLTMFNENRPKERASLKQQGKQRVKPAGTVILLPPLKNRPFFSGPSDKRIQEGINWVMENDKAKVAEKWQAMEEELYDVIKSRSNDAKRDVMMRFGAGDGKREKFSSLRNAKIPVLEEQDYDFRWRLSEWIQEEMKGRGRGKYESSPSVRGEGGRPGRGRGRGRGEGSNQDDQGESYHNRGRGEGFHRRGRGEGFHSRGRGEGYHSRGRGEGYHPDRNGNENNHDGEGNEMDKGSRGRGDGGYHRGRGGRISRGRGRGGRISRGRGRGSGGRTWGEGGNEIEKGHEGGSHNQNFNEGDYSSHGRGE